MNQIQLNSVPPQPVSDQSDEELKRLLARVSVIPANRKIRTWLFPILLIVGLFVMTAICGMTGLIDKGWPYLIAILAVPVIVLVAAIAINRRELRDIEGLAKYEDIRAVGGLLEGVSYGNRQIKRSVHRSLEQLLPRLTETDAGLLSTGQREALNMLLYNNSPELAMAALLAIQRVGDGTALPYLTAMAAGKGIPGALQNRSGEVQEYAQQAAQRIQARIDFQNRANVLLRASQRPDTPSDQLVRPAYNTSQVEAEELLRPDTPGEEKLKLDLDLALDNREQQNSLSPSDPPNRLDHPSDLSLDLSLDFSLDHSSDPPLDHPSDPLLDHPSDLALDFSLDHSSDSSLDSVLDHSQEREDLKND